LTVLAAAERRHTFPLLHPKNKSLLHVRRRAFFLKTEQVT
jgi:hypothetical protein